MVGYLVAFVVAGIAGPPPTLDESALKPPLAPVDAIIGITAPYRQATLAAIQPGRIASIHVDEGASVRAGDPVVQLDDEVQRARTELAQAESESTHEIELALARWEGARKELARLRLLRGDNHASTKELDDATTAEAIARIEHELAKFQHAQARQVYYREQRVLDEYRLIAPFSGYAYEHLKHPGETVDEREGIITLMQLDPLKVVVDCPLTMSPKTSAGQPVVVTPVDAQWAPRWGRVILAHRVADGASQTFRVKVAVDNPDGRWLSGMKVSVSFGDDVVPEAKASPHEPGPGQGDTERGP